MSTQDSTVPITLTQEQLVTKIIEEQKAKLAVQNKLSQQTLEEIDLQTITPLTPAIISRQATINIGTIGHVAHGKTTLVRAISGVNTIRHLKETVRNITIKLGYANAKLYKCPVCPAPECYTSSGSAKEDILTCKVKDCNATL